MKRMVEEVLKQKRLVPIAKEQLRRKSPFTENILGKPISNDITPYAGKNNLDDHI